ncbi:MAG: hypothetical protein GY715_07835 [Planctomycetes bacterium]|nr:hypothetical protein [Planctomycetota bacterium]
MPHENTHPRRRRGRGARPLLIQIKVLGLIGFLGGLGSLVAIGVLGPDPADPAGWHQLRETMRAVFWPCLFSGLMVTNAAGVVLWLRHPREFLRMRWFRVKAVLLAAALPLMHLLSRGRVTEFYAAIEAGSLDVLPSLRDRVTAAFAVALLVMLAIAAIGRIKPRLGEPVGRRRRPDPPA